MRYDWFCADEIENIETGELYQVDYSRDLGMYRVSIFKDNHFQDDIVFDEMETFNGAAYKTLFEIIKVVKEWEEFKDGGEAYDRFSKIRDILKEGEWLDER